MGSGFPVSINRIHAAHIAENSSILGIPEMFGEHWWIQLCVAYAKRFVWLGWFQDSFHQDLPGRFFFGGKSFAVLCSKTLVKVYDLGRCLGSKYLLKRYLEVEGNSFPWKSNTKQIVLFDDVKDVLLPISKVWSTCRLGLSVCVSRKRKKRKTLSGCVTVSRPSEI